MDILVFLPAEKAPIGIQEGGKKGGGGGEFLKGEIGKVSSFSTWGGRRGRVVEWRGTGRNICPVSAFYGGYVKGEKLYI